MFEIMHRFNVSKTHENLHYKNVYAFEILSVLKLFHKKLIWIIQYEKPKFIWCKVFEQKILIDMLNLNLPCQFTTNNNLPQSAN